jgi:hypothetical protein
LVGKPDRSPGLHLPDRSLRRIMHAEKEKKKMAPKPIWIKTGKCNLHVAVSGRTVQLRIQIPATVTKNLIWQVEKKKTRKKKE